MKAINLFRYLRSVAPLLLLSTMAIFVNTVAAQETQNEVIVNNKKKRDISFEYRFSDNLDQTPDSKERLNKWFQDAKFGAFIHFGVYSSLEGEYKGRGSQHRYSEWVQISGKIPTLEYHKVASQFNPSEFDAEEWVKVFKNAGMRYVVITSKHHDGFALFKSNVSNYNIVDYTPFKRDIIKELSEACHRNGLKFGVYYSHAQDWDEPNAPFLNKRASLRDIHPDLPGDFEPDMDVYIKNKSLPQVEELVKNYEIDLLWFDTPVGMTFERAKLFSDMVRKYRPDCIINSRIIHNGKSRIEAENLPLFDYVSIGDKEVPTKRLPLYIESPDCVSSSFGYKTKGNVYYHDEKELMERFVHTVCTGGNYLLNNGPMGNGNLDPEAIKLYGIIGNWMKLNSESIHDTKPNPFTYRPIWGDICTNREGNTLYLHALNVPENGVISLNEMPAEVISANYLANGEKVEFKQEGENINFTISDHSIDSLDVVIKVMMRKSTPIEKKSELDETLIISDGSTFVASDFFPKFSWKTTPLYFMFGDKERVLHPEEVQFIAERTDFLCIEKSHGFEMLGAAELGAKYDAAAFKKIKPDMKVLFYFNAALAWPYTSYSKYFAEERIDSFPILKSYLLKNPKTGEMANKFNTFLFDVLNPEFREWWVETVAAGVRESGCDGAFIDQMHGNVNLRKDKRTEIEKAMGEMMARLKETLGADKILLANNANSDNAKHVYPVSDALMFENYADIRSSKENLLVEWGDMLKNAKEGKISVFRLGVEGHGRGYLRRITKEEKYKVMPGISQDKLEFALACYLIGAQPYSYFMYSWGWTLADGSLVNYPELQKPLGAPKGPYTRVSQAGWEFTREFAHASIWVDTENRQAEITWR